MTLSRSRAARVTSEFRDRRRSLEEVARHDIRRQWAHFLREPLPPPGRSDPRGLTSERATRLDVLRFVADHPSHPGSNSKIPRCREEHPRPRLSARAIREDVVGTIVDGRDIHALFFQPRDHVVVDPTKLPLP